MIRMNSGVGTPCRAGASDIGAAGARYSAGADRVGDADGADDADGDGDGLGTIGTEAGLGVSRRGAGVGRGVGRCVGGGAGVGVGGGGGGVVGPRPTYPIHALSATSYRTSTISWSPTARAYPV